MQLILMPYKATSGGSKLMAKKLGINRVLRDDNFNPKDPVVCINWGRGDFPWWGGVPKKWINSPECVMRSINKIKSLLLFKRAGVPCPEFTTSKEVAQKWINSGHVVLARMNTEGMDGDGIEIIRQGMDLPTAPLYTIYQEKETEYRVHVMNGECFYANQKRPDGWQKTNQMIRTSSGGWYFRHMDTLPSKAVQHACEMAVEALGLDFAGVDVGVSKEGIPCVYEVNTAPEMGPNTTNAYFKAFKKHYGEYKNNENIALRDL